MEMEMMGMGMGKEGWKNLSCSSSITVRDWFGCYRQTDRQTVQEAAAVGICESTDAGRFEFEMSFWLATD